MSQCNFTIINRRRKWRKKTIEKWWCVLKKQNNHNGWRDVCVLVVVVLSYIKYNKITFCGEHQIESMTNFLEWMSVYQFDFNVLNLTEKKTKRIFVVVVLHIHAHSHNCSSLNYRPKFVSGLSFIMDLFTNEIVNQFKSHQILLKWKLF